MDISVIKIGGNVIDHQENCSAFLKLFAHFPGVKILVHGGGVLASRLGSSLGIKPYRQVSKDSPEPMAMPSLLLKGLLRKSTLVLLGMLQK